MPKAECPMLNQLLNAQGSMLNGTPNRALSIAHFALSID